jgi:hypothetical protein
MNKEKILLVQLFSNGDCLFVTTIARQIKINYPDCELTWQVSSKCKSMLLHNPDVDLIEEVEISDATQNRLVFDSVVTDAMLKKQEGIYDRIIIPQLLGSNMKFYDGIVCTSLYRASGLKITVDTKPVLILTDVEKQTAAEFAQKNNLCVYKNIVLFECAPQTNQLLLTDEIILDYCLRIISNKNTCVILSAPKAYNFLQQHILDGNTLSIRETVALTHHCTHLLGCSSGISWAATSNEAKLLPTIQILAPDAYYFNPLSLTFRKLNRSTENLLELIEFNNEKIQIVFKDIFQVGFQEAKEKHHQQVKIQFKLFRGIIHQFLLEGKFSEIVTFVRVNWKEHGFNLSMIKYLLQGFVLFPFQWLMNKANKS